MAITTDVIAGFPGETEQEFLESLSFIEQMGFAGGHVFTYQPGRAPAAARMPDQVPHPLRRIATPGCMRSSLNLLTNIRSASLANTWTFFGKASRFWLRSMAHERVDGQLPADNRTSPQYLWNQITPVRLLRSSGGEIEGRLVENVRTL
jgi:threonylcarbamoyladenosine tRNA methylthiotransferase MtaB